jgi:adenylate kinase family enzyme
MRVAIIGGSGSGRTTLANTLGRMVFSRPVRDLADLWARTSEAEALVLDGIPDTVEELEKLDAKAPGGRSVDHVLYLRAPVEIRLERIARMVVVGADVARARDRMLHPADLDDLRTYLDGSDRLTIIDAARTRGEVLLDALEALGLES